MERFHTRRRHLALRNVKIEAEAIAQLSGVAIGLTGEITRVNPDDRDRLRTFKGAEHVQKNGGLNPEACGQGETGSEALPGPIETIDRSHGFEHA